MIFSKLNGLGNDFVITDDRENKYTENLDEMARKLCHRRTGIGADGLVFVRKSETCDVRMQIFNSDGSEGMMAGNALRCVGKYLFDRGLIHRHMVSVETIRGTHQITLYTTNGKVTSACVSMGKASLDASRLPNTQVDEAVSAAIREGRLTAVNPNRPGWEAVLTAGPTTGKNRVMPSGRTCPVFFHSAYGPQTAGGRRDCVHRHLRPLRPDHRPVGI